MAIKLELKNNYIVLTDTVTLETVEYPKARVRYKDYSNNIQFKYIDDTSQDKTYQFSELVDENEVAWTDLTTLLTWLRKNTGSDAATLDNEGVSNVNINRNELGFDAWGRQKTINDYSILHGMFTFNVPVSKWKETFNGSETTFTNANSVDGKLVLKSGTSLNDNTVLDSYRNPRYQPNRGHLYSTACIMTNPNNIGVRQWGLFTEENGVFFSLESGVLYAIIRTTNEGTTTEDKKLIDTTGIDLSKGNVYDIQFQWRGVGNYKFFINLQEVYTFEYLGTLTKLSISNPALPIAFKCENLGDEVEMRVGCVDVTSEGGDVNGKTYGSIEVSNESGQVSVSGYNQPIIAVRSKLTVDGKRNTRDTLALLASGYSDNKSFLRVWATRDFTAITENNQSWQDFGDGHLEYIVYDVPDVATPMTFDTTKAEPSVFGCRVGQDTTYATSALFEGRTDIYLTPGDMFVFTMHRENGGTILAGVTFEFAEEI